jgi:hypothetical protein
MDTRLKARLRTSLDGCSSAIKDHERVEAVVEVPGKKGRCRRPVMSFENLNRYIDEHRCRPLDAILAGLEEHDLWKNTPFESGRSLARRLLEESVEVGGGPSAAAMEETLALAAKMVKGRTEEAARGHGGYVSAVNRLCRDLLVVRILEDKGLAEAE